jgi:hypothetical protein
MQGPRALWNIIIDWAWGSVSLASGGGAVIFQMLFLFRGEEVPQKWLVWSIQVFGVFACWQAVYNERQWRKTRISREKPRLLIRPQDFQTEEFYMDTNIGRLKFRSITVTVTNDPERTGSTSDATGVSAWITVLDEFGTELLAFQGRWSDSVQPPNLPQGMTLPDIAIANIPVGTHRKLDLLFKEPSDQMWWAVNNESFNYRKLKKPELALQPKPYTFRVRFRSTQLDQCFDLRIERLDNFNFGVGECTAVQSTNED